MNPTVLMRAAQLLILTLTATLCRGAAIEDGFSHPPDSARPWTYWFWMNGNITREGITADLEAMKRVGIGGVLIMEVGRPGNMAPPGRVAFASDEWRQLFKHVVAEAKRLGLQINMNNDAGWCGSGGPWITPELSMQKLTSSATTLQGPRRFEGTLSKPKFTHDYYRDVKVLALPLADAGGAIAKDSIVDLTPKMDREGKLTWDVPQGTWRVLRIGCTTTGVTNKPSPATGQGLECDKFNAQAISKHFDSFIARLADDVGADAGPVFTTTHIDSWEVGTQNWTGTMEEEFRKRRGYDLMPWLAVLAEAATVGSADETERFKWDYKRTQSELNDEAYAGTLRRLASKRGLKLTIEAYGTGGFLNPLTYGAQADEPMAEFWTNRWGAWHLLSPRLLASVCHVYGKPILGAESFTSSADSDAFTQHPYTVKATGDWAMCEGINRFVFHRTALNPWPELAPGMSFAGFGWHVDPAQPWFESGRAYMQYLARCQWMLRQGQFVADVCRLVPTGEDYGKRGGMATLPDQYDAIPAGYNYDYISDKALMEQVSVSADGSIITAGGMHYRLLQLPNGTALTPEVMGKLIDLARRGAAIYGPEPRKSPSLNNYPQCDHVVQSIATKLRESNSIDPDKPLKDSLTIRCGVPDFAFRINPTMTAQSIASLVHVKPSSRPSEPLVEMPTDGLSWIHRRIREIDIYFVANPQHRDVDALCRFRVRDRRPELWNPMDGTIQTVALFRQDATQIELPIHFDPAGSVFVVFQSPRESAGQVVSLEKDGKALFGSERLVLSPLPNIQRSGGQTVVTGGAPGRYRATYGDGAVREFEIKTPAKAIGLNGKWHVRFQPGRGAPDRVELDHLVDWSGHPDPGVRYFSGRATYLTGFNWSNADDPSYRWQIDLGDVQVMAEVKLNGKDLGVLWKPPFVVDVSSALQSGANELEVVVSNLWPNRLIGDEQFPDDCTPDGTWTNGPIPAWPAWLLDRKPRPDPRRLTFTTWKYYTGNSPLVSSGLIGPVELRAQSVEELKP